MATAVAAPETENISLIALEGDWLASGQDRLPVTAWPSGDGHTWEEIPEAVGRSSFGTPHLDSGDLILEAEIEIGPGEWVWGHWVERFLDD